MASTHETDQTIHQTEHVDRELYDEVRDRVHRLESQVTAVKAVVNRDEPDYLASIYAASQLVYALLALPDERPGSWEAPHSRRSPGSCARSSTCSRRSGPSSTRPTTGATSE